MRFNPRAPCGARLASFESAAAIWSFQSTRPVRGATHLPVLRGRRRHVSIHAPRAGRDPARTGASRPQARFNPRAPCGARRRQVVQQVVVVEVSIHAPRAGRDVTANDEDVAHVAFQSTRPVRGATRRHHRQAPGGRFQSTRPVRGATFHLREPRSTSEFQSTRPVRGATRPRSPPGCRRRSFNPRAPCGARRLGDHHEALGVLVSIHAPRAGRDGVEGEDVRPRFQFQSTRPVRGAT